MHTDIAPTPAVAIRPAPFDATRSAQSVLCVEVSKDRFRFVVSGPSRRLGWLEEYTFASLLAERPLTDMLPALLQNHPVLQTEPGRHQPWQQVYVAVNSPSFTLVPKPLYRREYASNYLALMRGAALPADELAQAYEHESGIVSVFSLEYRLLEFFAAHFPLQQLAFVHQTTPLMRVLEAVNRHTLGATNLMLYFEDEFVTVIQHAGQQLQYCNRFGYKTAQDLAYYVLYVVDELKLDPHTVNTLLYGEITPYAETYAELARFMRHLHVGLTPPGLTLADEFDELPEHRYASLYGLALL